MSETTRYWMCVGVLCLAIAAGLYVISQWNAPTLILDYCQEVLSC